MGRCGPTKFMVRESAAAVAR